MTFPITISITQATFTEFFAALAAFNNRAQLDRMEAAQTQHIQLENAFMADVKAELTQIKADLDAVKIDLATANTGILNQNTLVTSLDQTIKDLQAQIAANPAIPADVQQAVDDLAVESADVKTQSDALAAVVAPPAAPVPTPPSV